MSETRQHVPDRTLAEYSTGELSLLKRVEVETHIAGCSSCAEKLVAMKDLIAKMRGDASLNSPPNIIDRAVRAFQSKNSHSASLSGLAGRVLAILRFDSSGLAPVFGVRSGMLGTRQLLFSAGPDEIDLRIEPADQDWTVSGQILGKSPPGGKAILAGQSSDMREVPLNELSEFVITPVQAGVYKLILVLNKTEIEIEEIRIGY
jgi:hypothetical protein